LQSIEEQRMLRAVTGSPPFIKVQVELKANRGLSIARMVKLGRVSRSGFYRFEDAEPDAVSQDDLESHSGFPSALSFRTFFPTACKRRGRFTRFDCGPTLLCGGHNRLSASGAQSAIAFRECSCWN
jgi:hypothetical protein